MQANLTADNEKHLNMTKMSINSVANNSANMIGQILSAAAQNFAAHDDFFGDLNSANIENEWNISYTLRISMLPHCYIS